MDRRTMEVCEIALRKLRADLHVVANALETGNAKLLLAASSDLQAGGEFFAQTIVNLLMPDAEVIELESHDKMSPLQKLVAEYDEAIRAVDPVLAERWDNIV